MIFVGNLVETRSNYYGNERTTKGILCTLEMGYFKYDEN